MNKVYQRINWENYPNDATPLSAQNLNRLDVAADELDNRLIAMDTVKMDKITAATMVKDIAYNEENGNFTVTYLDGSSYTLDTKLEKLAVNVTYDPAAEQLVILLDDGATQRVDLSALVTEHEFLDSDTVGFTVDETGAVRAQLRDGSVTEEKLRPDYLSDIRVESAKAQAAGAAAAENAAQAEISAKEAESYAKGGTGVRPGEDTDNALYYSSLAETQADRAKAEADRATAEILDRVMTEETAGIGRPDGVTITVDEEGVLTASVAGKTSDLENDSGFAVAAALTQEEYDALPEEKLTDGKLYLVRDVAGESGQLIRNGVDYGTDHDLRERLGAADISAVGDGTVTGAIRELNTDIAGKAPASHSHAWGGIMGKPSTFTPSDHTHAWGAITGKPVTFAPSAHTHDDRYYLKSEVNVMESALSQRCGTAVRWIGLFEQEITLAGGTTFFQSIPSQYCVGGYFYNINCTGNSLNFTCNMEGYNMAVRNTSSSTLTTRVQVYIMSIGV